ncbi:MAG: hypothetical protein JWM20_909 [Patescibacteria group bacterium]|nr:hypothetical protein [Patescibacteria group bacterium]
MFAIFGWGRKSKSWLLPDGSHVLAYWRYFHIFWCPLAFNIKWHLVGDNRSEDKVITHEKVKELMPHNTPDLNAWQRYGLLMAAGVCILIAIISGATSQDTSFASSNAQQSQASYNSLPTGTVLLKLPSYFEGSGRFTIKNGTSDDAVVKLVDNSANTSIYSVYLKANSNYTVESILDGNYKVIFTSGKNWDASSNKFLVSPDYEKFEDILNFETTDDQLTHYSLTLNPVVGGTAETATINPSEFNSY